MTLAISKLASLKRYLEADVAHSQVTETQQLVLEYGASYVGIKRPRSFRLGPKKNCFANATEAIISPDKECSRSVTYVEGYAMCPDQPPVHHAWLALDGKDAVELTIRSDPREMTFFGVAFSKDELLNIISEDMTYEGVFRYPPRDGLRESLELRTLNRGVPHHHAPE
jgi:hypothetical protein